MGTATATTSGTEIRFAESREEREAIFRLRYEVYVAEMNMFAEVADHEARHLRDDSDDVSELLVALVDGEPAAAMRLTFGSDAPFSPEYLDTFGMDRFDRVVPREGMLVFTRFIVRRAHRRSEVPFALFTQSARIGRRRGVELAFCDCQPHLINLYARLGFRPYRQTYNDPHMALMVPLVMVGGDGDHLRAIDSPLLGNGLDRAMTTTDVARRAAAALPARPPVRGLPLVGPYYWGAEVADGDQGRALRLFAGLDDREQREFLADSHIIDVAPGGELIRRGQVTRTLYVLLGGELQYRSGPRQLASPPLGEVVGHEAFLLKTPRTMGVRAGPLGARVLSLNEAALRRVVESNSRTAAVLLLNLCRMLAARTATGG